MVTTDVGIVLCIIGLMLIVPALLRVREVRRRERWFGVLAEERERQERLLEGKIRYYEEVGRQARADRGRLELERMELEKTQMRGRSIDPTHRPFTVDEIAHYAHEIEGKRLPPGQHELRMAVIRYDLRTPLHMAPPDTTVGVDYISFSRVRYREHLKPVPHPHSEEYYDVAMHPERYFRETEAWAYNGPVLAVAPPSIVRYYDAFPARSLGAVLKRVAEESGYHVPFRPEELERTFNELIMRRFMVPPISGRWSDRPMPPMPGFQSRVPLDALDRFPPPWHTPPSEPPPKPPANPLKKLEEAEERTRKDVPDEG